MTASILPARRASSISRWPSKITIGCSGATEFFDIFHEGGRAHRSPTKFSGGGEVRHFGTAAHHNGRRGFQIGSGEFEAFFSLRGGGDQVEPDVGSTEVPFHDPMEVDDPDTHGAEAEAVWRIRAPARTRNLRSDRSVSLPRSRRSAPQRSPL